MRKYFLLLLATVFLTASSIAFAAEAPEQKGANVKESGWEKRCPQQNKDKKGKAQCEIFNLINVEESGMRVAEFAIGFPEEAKLEKGTARGVIILPLGILLEHGITMTVDENKPAVFQPRFCINARCFSFVNLNQKLLKSFKMGNNVKFSFKVSGGQDVNLIMSLKGFSKALKGIQ